MNSVPGGALYGFIPLMLLGTIAMRIEQIDDLTRVVISYEIYETNLRRVS